MFACWLVLPCLLIVFVSREGGGGGGGGLFGCLHELYAACVRSAHLARRSLCGLWMMRTLWKRLVGSVPELVFSAVIHSSASMNTQARDEYYGAFQATRNPWFHDPSTRGSALEYECGVLKFMFVYSIAISYQSSILKVGVCKSWLAWNANKSWVVSMKPWNHGLRVAWNAPLIRERGGILRDIKWEETRLKRPRPHPKNEANLASYL